jgi:hypothetical protein
VLAACCVGVHADVCVTGFGRGKVSSFLYDVCSVMAFWRALGVGLVLQSCTSAASWRPSSGSEWWDIGRMERAILMVYQLADGIPFCDNSSVLDVRASQRFHLSIVYRLSDLPLGNSPSFAFLIQPVHCFLSARGDHCVSNAIVSPLARYSRSLCRGRPARGRLCWAAIFGTSLRSPKQWDPNN